jgi:plasmid maintenance system antidote protein VapI
MEDKRMNFKGRLKTSFWSLLGEDDHVRWMLNAFIKDDDLSQNKLCKKLHISPVSLSRYLNQSDAGRISDLDIVKLLRYFGITPEIKLTIKEDDD